MKVVVAPVSTRILVRWLLTSVVKKINDDLGGFVVFSPETTPSFDGSGTRNLNRSKPHVQAGYIVYK
jgi:hypothetical protein